MVYPFCRRSPIEVLTLFHKDQLKNTDPPSKPMQRLTVPYEAPWRQRFFVGTIDDLCPDSVDDDATSNAHCLSLTQ